MDFQGIVKHASHLYRGVEEPAKHLEMIYTSKMVYGKGAKSLRQFYRDTLVNSVVLQHMKRLGEWDGSLAKMQVGQEYRFSLLKRHLKRRFNYELTSVGCAYEDALNATPLHKRVMAYGGLSFQLRAEEKMVEKLVNELKAFDVDVSRSYFRSARRRSCL